MLLCCTLGSAAMADPAAVPSSSAAEAAVKKVFAEDDAREKKHIDGVVRAHALYWPEAVIIAPLQRVNLL
jgi:hypothetical protein